MHEFCAMSLVDCRSVCKYQKALTSGNLTIHALDCHEVNYQTVTFFLLHTHAFHGLVVEDQWQLISLAPVSESKGISNIR